MIRTKPDRTILDFSIGSALHDLDEEYIDRLDLTAAAILAMIADKDKKWRRRAKKTDRVFYRDLHNCIKMAKKITVEPAELSLLIYECHTIGAGGVDFYEEEEEGMMFF